MKNSRRLSLLCGELEDCGIFADIGCDHGYCTQYMLDKGLCRYAQFSDISANSLKKAETLLSAYISAGRAEPVVCAGLEKIDTHADLVLIAGMGGEEIVKILRDGFLPPVLVLQPMKNSEKVRAYLLENGYGITKDVTFFAEGKFYDLIKAKKGAERTVYTEDMLVFGKDNLLHPGRDFVKKLERDIGHCRVWLEASKEGRNAILARLAKLEEIYDETCRRIRDH